MKKLSTGYVVVNPEHRRARYTVDSGKTTNTAMEPCMDNNSLQQILELDGEARYDYFLDAVVEERDIWILVNADNQFLKIVAEEDGVAYLPVWPNSEFAEHYATGSEGLSPKAVSLPDFFRKWVSGLTRDGLELGVFPGMDEELWITSPEELKQDLQELMSSAF